MASVQRDHWSYIVLQCLILNLLLCRNGTFADRNKYYHISTLCVKDRQHPLYKKIDGAVLTSEGEDNSDCVITFQTDSILQRFMLKFERLALDCNDHLYIFDGAHAFGNHKADLSCRSTRAEVGTIFTHSNFVTLKYETDRWSQAGNGFRLVISAFKDSPVGCRDFRCMNTFCLSQDLVCDDVNHCGDNSDETAHASCIDESAGNQILGLGVSTFVSIVVSVFVVCSICVVGIAICLCRKDRQNDLQPESQHATTHLLNAGHPAYPKIGMKVEVQVQDEESALNKAAPRYNESSEELGEKPPPYPGNMYPSPGIAYNVPHESLYYPTK